MHSEKLRRAILAFSRYFTDIWHSTDARKTKPPRKSTPCIHRITSQFGHSYGFDSRYCVLESKHLRTYPAYLYDFGPYVTRQLKSLCSYSIRQFLRVPARIQTYIAILSVAGLATSQDIEFEPIRLYIISITSSRNIFAPPYNDKSITSEF